MGPLGTKFHGNWARNSNNFQLRKSIYKMAAILSQPQYIIHQTGILPIPNEKPACSIPLHTCSTGAWVEGHSNRWNIFHMHCLHASDGTAYNSNLIFSQGLEALGFPFIGLNWEHIPWLLITINLIHKKINAFPQYKNQYNEIFQYFGIHFMPQIWPLAGMIFNTSLNQWTVPSHWLMLDLKCYFC